MSVVPKRVLIVGMPRSGTTLLATLLAAQRGCSFITEYVPVFFAASKKLGVPLDAPLSATERRVALSMARDQFLRLGHPVLVKADAFRTLDELHRAILDEVAGIGDVVVGHKLVLSPREAQRLIDETDCLAILMLRDPRDAALSFWHRMGGGVEHYLEDYRAMVALSRRANPSRLITIRFEQLVGEPEKALAPLSEALDVSVETALSQLGFQNRTDGGATPFEENSAFGDVEERFASQPIGRYLAHQGSEVVRFAAWFCADEITGLGYPASPPDLVSNRDRARFRLRLVGRRTSRWLTRAAERATRVLETVAPPIRHR